MKHKILAASLALALAGATVSAQAIQGFTIDTNGAAAGGDIVNIINPGFFFSNMLAKDSVVGLAGIGNPGGGAFSADAEVFAHGVTQVNTSGGTQVGELTYNLSLPTTTTISAGGLMGFTDSGLGRIDIYFDASNDAWDEQGDTPAGAEYTNGTKIISGAFTFGAAAGGGISPFFFSSTCLGPMVNPKDACAPTLADNNATDTLTGIGSLVIDIDFDFVDAAYVAQDLTDASIALTTFSDALSLAFPSGVDASDKFNGGAETVNYGDAENDMQCTGVNTCDIQFYMNATTKWANVPEPGTLALMGAALGFVGMRRRKFRKV